MSVLICAWTWLSCCCSLLWASSCACLVEFSSRIVYSCALMSLAKTRRTSGVDMTSDSTTASASLGTAIRISVQRSRVAPMLSTRKRSRFRMMTPQHKPRTREGNKGTFTPSCSAKIIARIAMPAVVSSTPAICTKRALSRGASARIAGSAPPSQAMKSPMRLITFRPLPSGDVSLGLLQDLRPEGCRGLGDRLVDAQPGHCDGPAGKEVLHEAGGAQ